MHSVRYELTNLISAGTLTTHEATGHVVTHQGMVDTASDPPRQNPYQTSVPQGSKHTCGRIYRPLQATVWPHQVGASHYVLS